MQWPIARGRLSHSIYRELVDLLFCIFAPLNKSEMIENYELVLSEKFNSNQVKIFPFARTAFYAVLESLELQPGSKILMPSISIKPFLDIVLHFQLTPIFADLDPKTGVWETKQLENALSENPQAALLTYLFGVVPNIGELFQVLRMHDVIVIEDFSHSFNASYRNQKLGTFGDFGICSSSITKSFDTYGGGLLVINNEKYSKSINESYVRLRPTNRGKLLQKIIKNLIFNLATNSFIFSLITFKIIKLRNSKSTSEVGKFTGNRSLEPLAEIPENWFHHFSSFQAKIGMREIEEIPPRDEKRRAISLRYSKELDSVGPRGNEDGISTYWQYISIVAQPVTFRQHLNRNGIDCATTSLVNMTKLPKYDLNLEFQKTDEIYLNGVYLPCYHQLSEAQQNRLISIIKLYRE